MDPSQIIGTQDPHGPINLQAQHGQELKISIKGDAQDVQHVFEKISSVLPIEKFSIHYANHPVHDDEGRQIGRYVITRYYLDMSKEPRR